jgi:hypothetical protein
VLVTAAECGSHPAGTKEGTRAAGEEKVAAALMWSDRHHISLSHPHLTGESRGSPCVTLHRTRRVSHWPKETCLVTCCWVACRGRRG